MTTASPVTVARVELSTGTLRVRVDASALPPAALCGFAARRNPRRGFLFVSRVLGRHVPVPPSRMRRVEWMLARHVPRHLPGPVLFVGLAETAVGLGQGVEYAYRRLHRRADTLYLHSTRCALPGPPLLDFREEHSHAPAHVLYEPAEAAARKLLHAARSVVLVDDEATTGRTFRNLCGSLARVLPGLRRCVTAVLTDWSGGDGHPPEEMPLSTVAVSLLRGSWRFTPRAGMSHVSSPAADNACRLVPERDFGRLGGRVGQGEIDAKARSLFRGRGERLLVLGTGEFVYAPSLLAGRLEEMGARVRFGATTRSPVLPGHAIERILAFGDNYGQGIPHYLYNVRAEDYDRVLLCHETPPGSVDPRLLGALGAEPVPFA